MADAALEVQRLAFRYRQSSRPALREASFRVPRGALVLVAGASGSGKTTLLRILNGLIPHAYRGHLQGSLRILGRDPTGVPLAQRSQWVGTVLQDPERQIIGAYVRNDVAFGLENLAVPRAEMRRRVDAVLQALDIAHLRDRETYALSGGEKQKVAVAGTLVMEPEVLLLDEPLANLDPAGVDEALALVRRLVAAGKTVLLIEHRVEEVLRINPDLVLFLEDGAQRYFGPVEGFLQVAHPQEVKLPAGVAVRRLRALGLLGEPPPRRARQPEAEPLVALERVSFGYTEARPVLRGISAAIYPGDVIAVLGPNGAGKTTLVRHLIGLAKPWQGRVLVQGRDTRDASVAQMARTVGFVFQNPRHMLFAPTVWEEFAFGPRNLGFPEARVQANVERSLRIVDLEAYAQTSPLALSFGQQRRAAIGAVLSMEPSVLVLDEPTAGQDYRHYIAFMDAIVQMPFAAIVFITHDLDLAVRYANRVWLVHQGQIIADGPPEEVLTQDALLEKCHLRPTSLLRLNRRWLPRVGRFLTLEEWARRPDVSLADLEASLSVEPP